MKREEEQEKLKKKYQIEKNVWIIEKNNTLKFLIKTLGRLVRLVVNMIIFFLSLIGLSTILYPNTRALLLEQAKEVFEQVILLLP